MGSNFLFVYFLLVVFILLVSVAFINMFYGVIVMRVRLLNFMNFLLLICIIGFVYFFIYNIICRMFSLYYDIILIEVDII